MNGSALQSRLSATRVHSFTRALVLVLAFVGLASVHRVLFAQQTPAPISAFAQVASLSAGDFRALAVTEDDRLLVADAENEQVRVYNLTQNPPSLVTSVAVEGEPVQLASAGDYGLVVTRTENGGLLQTLTRSALNPRLGWEVLQLQDIDDTPVGLVTSPDSEWAIVIGESGYLLVQLLERDTINAIPVERPITAAALLNDRAFLAEVDTLAVVLLSISGTQARERNIPLPGEASALALSDDGNLGAVALTNGDVIPFRTEALDLFDPLPSVSDNAPAIIAFFTLNDAPHLAISAEGASTVAVYNLSDPAAPIALSPITLPVPLRAFTTHEGRLIVSDGTTISVYAAS